MNKLIFTVGLPGSGKTTFCEDYKKNNKNWTYINIDDKQFINYNYIKKSFNKKNTTILLDGLFLTPDDIITFIKNLDLTSKIILEIHFWNEDREACLWNDKYRRDKNSTITIKHAILEKPNIIITTEILHIIHNINYIEHNIIKKSIYTMFANKLGIYENIIKSDDWTTGGNVRGYDGYESTYLGEPSVNFDQFDEILEKIYPEISYIKCKRIFNNCVEVIESSYRDYYGGIRYDSHYECNVRILYSYLNETIPDQLEEFMKDVYNDGNPPPIKSNTQNDDD